MSEKRRIISNTLANGAAQFTAMASSLISLRPLIDAFGKADQSCSSSPRLASLDILCSDKFARIVRR